jgi:hypothetical protein
LGGGPPGFARSSTSSVLLWYASGNGVLRPSHTGLSPSVAGLSRPFRWAGICNPSRRPQPRPGGRFGLCPRSLAATDGIDVSFYSCGYLDVSVPRVRPDPPIHSAGSDRLLRPARFPDSEIHGSTPGCRLPVAYRRLQRPSSPLDAKTSTVHPCELDHHYRATDPATGSHGTGVA